MTKYFHEATEKDQKILDIGLKQSRLSKNERLAKDKGMIRIFICLFVQMAVGLFLGQRGERRSQKLLLLTNRKSPYIGAFSSSTLKY